MHTRSDGATIWYDDVGRGNPPLLFLPGWCASSGLLGEVPQLCARHRRVLVLDWRGHGRSSAPDEDFGTETMMRDALRVLDASGANEVIPVAQSHAGWIAIAALQALNARVSKLVLLDWLLAEPPAQLLIDLQDLQLESKWQAARDRLIAQWANGAADVHQAMQSDMGRHGFDMWARAAREISGAYVANGSPVHVLDNLQPSLQTLHVHAQAAAAVDPEGSAATPARSWLHDAPLQSRSRITTLETPEAVAERIEAFAAGRARS